MPVLTTLASALLLVEYPGPPSPQEILEASDGCYDAVFVGRMVKASDDFLDLNDILPAKPDHLYVGGITTALVRNDVQYVGKSPKLGWVRVIMNTVPLPSAKVLFVTKANPLDVPTVVYLNTLPRDAGSVEVRQALMDASVERCAK